MMDLPEGVRCNTAAGREFSKRYRSFKKIIGGNIRRIRKSQDMALRVLARRTGMSAERLDYWELGRMDIHLAAILRIAAALRVEKEDLLAGVHPSPPRRRGSLGRIKIPAFAGMTMRKKRKSPHPHPGPLPSREREKGNRTGSLPP